MLNSFRKIHVVKYIKPNDPKYDHILRLEDQILWMPLISKIKISQHS